MSESQPVRAAKTGPSAVFGCFPAAVVMRVAGVAFCLAGGNLVGARQTSRIISIKRNK